MLIALGNLGFDTEALMRDIGLSPALRDDPDARVPCRRFRWARFPSSTIWS
jgi:hypothetical protein